jgi:Ca-activated chloride channel family protein
MGRTSLLDALHMAMAQMKNARNLRKAIVLLSDGGDNHSRHTETEIKRAIHEADVQIYAMGIFDRNDSPKRPLEERNGPRLLTDLADETGGRQFPVEELGDLPSICVRISNELRDQYLLGYSPTNATLDGKYRRVKVVLAAPGGTPPLRVRHRVGYYAPLE